MATDLFLEVRCEEIPAHMLEPGLGQLATRLFEELMARNIAPEEVTTHFTPRRLVVAMTGLPESEPDRTEELTGPPASVAFDDGGEPTAAFEGFARKCGVAAEEVETVETAKGRYLVATRRSEGRPTPEVLAELLPEALRRIRWPKTMRWAKGNGPWVRPVHSMVALFGGQVVDFELFGVSSGRATVGHPLHSPDSFEVGDLASYEAALAERHVVVDFAARRSRLAEAMTAAAEERGGTLVPDDRLLDKLAAICEIPGVVLGDLGEIDLPREVMITSLRDHQSALAIEREGELLPFFLTLMDRPDDPDGRVRRGNEWVVAARLADARFFFDEDRKRTLEERRGELARVTFQERLGSYAEKSERIVTLAEWLCGELGEEEALDSVRQAARLLKVDLTSEMVKEFTSLQGVMGGIYAREEGLPEPVWQAIYDQYLPVSADDPIPRQPLGRIVSLADRLDTLVGMFGCGFAPTGSKDPFGLRRAAQGAVRILIEAELSVDARQAVRVAADAYDGRLERPVEAVLDELWPFLLDRVRHLLGREGLEHDEIDAALAVDSSQLVDHRRRARALHEARGASGFEEVVLAAKRIANILRGAEEHRLDEEALSEPAERDLWQGALELERILEEAEAAGDYGEGLRRIARFAETLDRFFVEVLVMAEDPVVRANRLALLQRIERILSRTAGLTEMVVERAAVRDD